MFDRFRRIRRTKRSLLLAALLCLVSFHASADSAIYGGGPFSHGGQAVMDDLRASGFTTVILFGVHVQTNGDLHFNNDPIISNGTYIGEAAGALPDDPIPAGEKREIDDDDRIYLGAWTRLVIREAQPGEL